MMVLKDSFLQDETVFFSPLHGAIDSNEKMMDDSFTCAAEYNYAVV